MLKMLRNEKGHLHFIFAGVLVAGALIVVPFMIDKYFKKSPDASSGYTSGGGSGQYVQQYVPDVARQTPSSYYPDADPNRAYAEQIILSSIGQQEKLFRLKAETIMLMWDSLDDRGRANLLANLNAEVSRQSEVVNRLVGEYRAGRLENIGDMATRQRVDDIVRSLSLQQESVSKLIRSRTGR